MNEIVKTVYKPWGKEIWLNDPTTNPITKYCYKRIYISSGHRTSFQYHNFKSETNYIISGMAEIWLEDDSGNINKKIMKDGDFFNVPPTKKHRVVALTDIILQEVSTPEVDDVIRIEDDVNRKSGKINAEHLVPAVCILAAGKGERLKPLTDHINKGLIPIKNKAIISWIIEKFPIDYEYVIAIGYMGDTLKAYCEMAHPNRKFIFVEIDDYESSNSGPGYSIRKCKHLLQRPFYFVTVDCLFKDLPPALDGDWLGVYETANPEKYSTTQINDHQVITDFRNKSIDGFSSAFIGLASIYNFEEFWLQLGDSKEVVDGWREPLKYNTLKAKRLVWFDTGNLDSLNIAKMYYGETIKKLEKNNGETFYIINDKFIKIFPTIELANKKYERSKKLGKMLSPNNIQLNQNILSYDWADGKTLYEHQNILFCKRFLQKLESLILKNNVLVSNTQKNRFVEEFYKNKTLERLKKIENRFPLFLSKRYFINGRSFSSLSEYLIKIDWEKFSTLMIPFSAAHGDLQFDNLIYNESIDRFTYIDWRDSFGSIIDYGDLYYDLAKLYGGSLLDYSLTKDENCCTLLEGDENLFYRHPWPEFLVYFIKEYEAWLDFHNFDFKHVKLITGLIYINMCPLHTDNLAKLLYCKSIEMLHNNI